MVEDLSDGYKVVQSVHALAEFSYHYRDAFEAWRRGSNYLCCLQASFKKLINIIDQLDLLGIKYTTFHEPDIGNQLTAIAVECLPAEVHKQFFGNLKLTS